MSRKFVYQQAAQGAQALEQAFASPANDDDVLFYLPVTKAWLRQVVLGLILLCHSSFRGVMAFFQDLLDCPLSLGTVHHIVQEAVTAAQQVNAAQELCGIRSAGHDELFQAGQPVLVGIDLDSTYCYLLAPVEHRDAETWGIHLLELAEQGLQPDYTIADGARGLRAGQALAWPQIPCNGDVFHGLRELTKLSATLERRAYAAIARREALARQMDKAKHRHRGRTFSTRLAHARAREVTAIRLASEVRILSGWMQHDILALAGPDTPTRLSLYDFVMECLQALEALDTKRIQPVRQTLVNQRDTLLAFAPRLDQELQTLAQRFAVPVARLRQILALQTIPTTTPDYWLRAGELHRALQGQFHPLQQALLELRARLHRASSLVENFNSRLRNYFFLRRQIGPRYLDLLRFFLNHSPFKRSQQPHRVGKTPAELLTGQAHPHWLEMLGFTRFQRAS
ncbi:MAG TPA: hypothetical protein VLV83_12570 [Acidobacteriota bacterium]|nr:hypothetical protein [Acidobacteriota bacterium]